MINVGFWNIGNKNNTVLLTELLFHHSLNILGLAEHKNSNLNLVTQNISHLTKRNFKQVNLMSRLALIVDDSVQEATLKQESNYFSIVSLKLSNSFEVLLVLVHLPSKLHSGNEDYILAVREIIDSLNDQEISLENRKSIILGDLNLDPYESSVIGAHALHAVSDRIVARRVARKVKDKMYNFFYNPMWAHYADGGGNAGGTYFYQNSSTYAPFWHIFDQALFRPSLLNNFNDASLQIIKKIHSKSLVTKLQRPIPSISDHLPIKFSINY